MTGLLHRLAARANGSAWTVRSDARLPFASETWGQAAIETPAPPTEPVALLQPSAAALAPHSPAAEAGEPTEPSAKLHAPDALPLQQQKQHQKPQQQHAFGQGLASEPSHALMPVPAMPHSTVQLHQQHQQPFATDAPLPTQPPGHRTALPQPAPDATAASRPVAAHPHTAPAFAQNAPEPLLPPVSAHSVAASAGLAPRANPGAWAATAQPAAREDTEVHIHIGRIDVTAVHEAPKPKSRARERTHPVSLDAYLAARHTK